MTNEDIQEFEQMHPIKSTTAQKHFKPRWKVFVVAILFAIVLGGALTIAFNNCSIWSGRRFVDIYIQKIAFVLYAGYPEKIRRRWVERVTANQRTDGGWNDRWLCFDSRKRPVFSLKQSSSDQHATVQALWLLCQVKYRYPEYFGLPPSASQALPRK
jgi:hypothetical protein